MNAYEIISSFVEILSLLIIFGGFIITLLTFIDKKNDKK